MRQKNQENAEAIIKGIWWIFSKVSVIVIVCCSVLQCVAMCCSALQLYSHSALIDFSRVSAIVIVCCSVLQCAAVRCSELQ